MCCLSEGAAACPGARFEVFAAIRRDSVPVRLIGRQVRVLLHTNDLVIFDGRQQVARHDRLTGRREAHSGRRSSNCVMRKLASAKNQLLVA